MSDHNNNFPKGKKPFPDEESLYRQIIDATYDLIFVIDLDGICSYLSPSFETITGQSRDTVLGHHFTEFLNPDEKVALKAMFQEGILSGKSNLLTTNFVLANGNVFPVESSISSLRDDTGKIIGRVGIARGIKQRIATKRSIQEKERKYLTVLSTIQDGYFEVSLSGVFTFVNRAYCQIFGYSQWEINGMNYRDVMPTKSADRIVKVFRELLENDDSYSPGYIEGEIIRKDGTIRYTNGSFTLMYDHKGDKAGYCGIVRDITERKQIEVALRESEEQYRTILETIKDGYYEVDLEGNLTSINNQFCDILDHDRTSCLGMNYHDFTDKESIHNIRSIFNALYCGVSSINYFTGLFIAKNNKKKHIEGSVALRYNKIGNIIGFCGMVRDVTERKIIEDRLFQSEEKYRTILENIQDGYYEIDLEGKFTFCNDSFIRIVGFERKEFIGKEFKAIVDTDTNTITRILKAYQQIKKTGKPISYIDWKFKRGDGNERVIEASATLIHDSEGSISGYRGVIRDITERKELEEAIRKRNEEIEKDLETAQVIQSKIVSEKIPKTDIIKISYKYLPLDAVGGDFFSFTKLREGGLGVFIGDVASHGVTAALFLTLIKAVSDNLLKDHALQPKKYITFMNRELYNKMPLSFLTAIYGFFNKNSNGETLFTFSSAGHPELIVYRAESHSVETITCKGSLIGVVEDLEFQEKTIPLKEKDKLFLYTDGMYEVFNENNVMLGYDELSNLILSSIADSLEDTMDSIIDSIHSFRGTKPLEDDLIIVGFEA